MNSLVISIQAAYKIWENTGYLRYTRIGKGTNYQVAKGPSLHAKLG